jgi:membrane associated rhomboid family serine protease
MDAFFEAPATYVLMLACVAISFVGFWGLRRKEYRGYFVFRAHDVARGKNLVGAVVSHFSHGDFGHLAVNMLVLFLFGPRVEETLGLVPYVIVYAASGLLGTAALFVRHRKDPRHSALGASGAIAGVVFATVIIAPEAKFYLFFLPVGVPAPIFAVLYVVLSSWMTGRGDHVAHEAHIGGALTGFVMAGLFYEAGFTPLVRAVQRLVS